MKKPRITNDMPWLSRQKDGVRPARMTAKTKQEHAAELERLTAEFLAQGNEIKRGHDCPLNPVIEHYPASGHARRG